MPTLVKVPIREIDIPPGMVFIGNRRILSWPIIDTDRTPMDLAQLGAEWQFALLRKHNQTGDPLIVKNTDGPNPKVAIRSGNLISVTFDSSDFWNGTTFNLIDGPGRFWYTLRDKTNDIVVAYGSFWITWAAARG